MRIFPGKLFSFIEVNCRFIYIHPCLSSILNVFYNIIYIDSIFKSYQNSDKYLYKKSFDFGQRGVKKSVLCYLLTKENTLYFLKVNKHWHCRKGWEKESNTVKGCKSVKSYPRVSQILRSCTSSGIIPYIFSFCFSWEAPVWSLPHCFIKKGKESKINPTLPNLLMWPELIRKNVGCGVETWNTMIWIWWCMALQEGSKIWIIMKSNHIKR